MRAKNYGFTLIELMIVVAIIAILAAIAIAAYQDYVIRSQVSEGLALSQVGGSKDQITEFYTEFGRLPKTAQSVSLPSAVSITGTYVSKVEIGTAAGAAGLIRVTFSSTSPFKANDAINGNYVVLSPIPLVGAMNWSCKSAAHPNTVAPKYLPPICRP